MVRLCWRCGAPHDEGTTVCPNCGAAFASSEDRYQTDGRTVAPASAPLPPPRYRRGIRPYLKYLIFAVVIGAVALFAFTSLSDDGSTSQGEDGIEDGMETVDDDATHSFNYASTVIDDPYSPGNKTITIELALKNLTYKDYNTGDFYIVLSKGKTIIDPISQTCDRSDSILPRGSVAHYKAVFRIPSEDADSVKLLTQGPVGMSIVLERDKTLSVR